MQKYWKLILLLLISEVGVRILNDKFLKMKKNEVTLMLLKTSGNEEKQLVSRNSPNESTPMLSRVKDRTFQNPSTLVANLIFKKYILFLSMVAEGDFIGYSKKECSISNSVSMIKT